MVDGGVHVVLLKAAKDCGVSSPPRPRASMNIGLYRHTSKYFLSEVAIAEIYAQTVARTRDF